MQRHFYKTNLFLPDWMGGELFLASEEYIRKLTPSDLEITYVAIRGVALGVSLANTLITFVTFSYWRVAVTVVTLVTAATFHKRYVRIKTERLDFLRSEEAKAVHAR